MSLRKQIVEILRTDKYTAKDISQLMHIPEKEVYEHLEHIQKSQRGAFRIISSECCSCGFAFSKRTTPRPPGKCPMCKSERITLPRFTVS